MEDEHGAIIGTRQIWGEEQFFGIEKRARRHHLHVVGQTGTGKTTLLRNLIIQDIEAGRGVGLIDPHGDLAEELLDYIPPHRTHEVVYFNPADHEHPIGFNLLGRVRQEHRHLVASGVLEAFRALWKDSWGPRTEFLLYASLAALLDCQNISLLGVQRMLVDDSYRGWVVKQIHDPVLRVFWQHEFTSYGKRLVREIVAPIQNKVGRFLLAPPLRNMLGQVVSHFDARYMMDHGRIFIANLAKGALGADKSNLMGALLVSQFQSAAMTRVAIPEESRRDFYFYVDEFQNVTSDSFMSILAEARKYRFCLTLSHQYLDQLRPEVRSAVFGNVGSLIAFRVGYNDAEILAKEFSAEYDARHLTELGNYEACVRLLAGGQSKQPFIGKMLPPLGVKYGRRARIIRSSRQKYGKRRIQVEEKMERWVQ